MKISIDKIQKITFLLLAKLKESKGDEIEISNDYYWDIVNEELYNPYEEPRNINLGQLSFDYELIQRVLKSDDAVAYDLKWLSNILKALGLENQTAF